MDETSAKNHDFAQLLFLIKSLYNLLQTQLSDEYSVISAFSIRNILNQQDKSSLKEWVLLYDHVRRFALNFRNKYPLELMITNQICDYLNHCESLFKMFNDNEVSSEVHNPKVINNIHSILDKIQRIKFLLIISIINHEDYLTINMTENDPPHLKVKASKDT